MTDLRKRIAKLEGLVPAKPLDVEELKARIKRDEQRPEIQKMLNDPTDPYYAEAHALLKKLGDYNE